MKDNHHITVSMISKRSLAMDKKRNLFIVLAIGLTTYMIASIFGIGISYFESIQMQNKRMQGSIANMAFYQPTELQLKQVYQLDYVESVGLGSYVATTKDIEDLGVVNMAYVDEEQWKHIFSPTYTNIEGHYVQGEDEIMLSRYILQALGIKEPIIGMEIPLSFVVNGTDELITKRFKLACIYNEYSHSSASGTIAIYTSSSFAEKYHKNTLDNTMVNLLFRDENKILENVDRVKQDLDFNDTQKYTVTPIIKTSVNNSMTFAIAMIILFLMVSGYLLIFNIMNISITRNVRFYGMLKTLGTSPKQIRSIVLGQVLRLCIIGIPLGCILSLVTSFAIIPSIILHSGIETNPVISFSPVIYFGATLFALITAIFASFSPARKASRISPMESLRYNSVLSSNTKKTFVNCSNTSVMALRNVFRNKSRAFVVMLSLFLSILTFTVIITIVNSMNIDYKINQRYYYDLSLSFHDTYPDYGADEKLLQRIEELDGINEMGAIELEVAELQYSDSLNSYVEWLGNNLKQDREDVIASLMSCGLKAVDSIELHEINKSLPEPIDMKAFERGELAYLIVKSGDEKTEQMAECLAELNEFDLKYGEEGNNIKIKNGGIIRINRGLMNETVNIYGPQILVSKTLLQSLYSKHHVTAINMNIDLNYENQVYNTISDMIKGKNISIESRYIARQEMKDAKTIMTVLGSGVSCILALIGLLNFINVMSVGIISRKREFAIMESIGMGKKQMRTLLQCEGGIYAGVTIISCFTIGNVITYFMFCMFKNVEEYAQFTYPVIPILVVYLAILLICTITPLISYRSISKLTLVDRLRDNV